MKHPMFGVQRSKNHREENIARNGDARSRHPWFQRLQKEPLHRLRIVGCRVVGCIWARSVQRPQQEARFKTGGPGLEYSAPRSIRLRLSSSLSRRIVSHGSNHPSTPRLHPRSKRTRSGSPHGLTGHEEPAAGDSHERGCFLRGRACPKRFGFVAPCDGAPQDLLGDTHSFKSWKHGERIDWENERNGIGSLVIVKKSLLLELTASRDN